MPEAGVGVRLEDGWRLNPRVALRPEPFGALAYHFGNRRLSFLRRPELVTVVRALAAAPDVRTALRESGVPEEQFTAYVGALSTLAESDMIHPRKEGQR
ncbi:mycofactocin system protein MftB [Nocardioides sp. Root151]|nr:mycofactocin system protein MftB [Nocardioides sp. Root140]KQZ76300.1 mycofactocin system protein MftB [Nocardioides sp. Root151]KRF15233.1 mycofactocin system protein MftB [Nocardioides sp. Soil796]